jgi:hypothetical protein
MASKREVINRDPIRLVRMVNKIPWLTNAT